MGVDAVLVQRVEAAKRRGVEPFGQDHVGRPVALADAERRLEIGRAFRLQLFLRLAEAQRAT